MTLGEPKPSLQTTERYRHILTDFFTGVSISVLGTTSISHDVQNAFYIRSADNSFYMSLFSTSFSFFPAPGLCLTLPIRQQDHLYSLPLFNPLVTHSAATAIFPKFQVFSCKDSGQFFPALSVPRLVPNVPSDALCPRSPFNGRLC